MQNRRLLLLLTPLLLAASEPFEQVSSADALSGVSFDDIAMPDHAEDVADYTLRATLDPVAHTVHGEGTITWRNTSTVPTSELWFHLYLNAFKNQRSVWLRGPALRGSGPLTDWGFIDVKRLVLRDESGPIDLWSHVELSHPGGPGTDATGDETDARVPLPRAIAPNETITLEVSFDDKLPSIVERTGYHDSFHFVGQWFPKLARLEPDGRWSHFPFHHLSEFHADFGTYDVTLDVPQAFVLGATGPIVESRVEGGRRIERRVQRDIHDFAFTAWDKWQSDTQTIDGVAVTILYPPGFKVVAQRELGIMRFALPHFGERYGRYPYPCLTIVHPPEVASEAGGMEYPTLITTGGQWYGPPGIFTIEHLAVHELGHQWFYGMLASNELQWPFLDEGVTSYAEQEVLRAWHGAGSVADALGLTVSIAAIHAVWGNHAVHRQPIAQPASEFTTGWNYSNLVYSRTASLLETMRRVYGEASTALALGRYARRFRWKHPVPDDLIGAFEEVLGAEPARTLRTALFDKGWVDYAVESVRARRHVAPGGVFDRDGKRETVSAGANADGNEATVIVSRQGSLSFPVEVELTFADGTTERRRWDGRGDATRIVYVGPKIVVAAVVDPDHAVPIDPDLTNNHATAPDQPRNGAPRTLERATYWGQLLMQAVSP